MSTALWHRLLSLAEVAVAETIKELPPDIAREAEKVPCLFHAECEEDPDILGRYGNFEPGEVSPANGPIVLYLLAIHDYCEDEGGDFADEVRLTYLHELGHHLGWDEDDLADRGLD